ncbi:MAG: hypothetical protein ABEJ56_00580 [Candidatus Nanohaloarchaea archaeon]
MSFVDDIKDTLDRGSSGSGNRSRPSTDSFDTGDSFDSDPDTGGDIGSQRSNSGNQPRSQRRQKPDSASSDTMRQGRTQDQHPNAQAGRPQEGSARPQVSNQTRREMENAGLQNKQRQADRNRRDSVAESSKGIEELKSQNQQIIELLKRINRNLEQLGR